MSDSLTRRARKAFSEWLGTYEWETFGTYTFARTPGRTATHHFRRLLAKTVRHGHKKPTAFVAEEIGPRGGRLHLHALCKDTGWKFTDLKREWERDYGIARGGKYDAARGAAHYVTKYIIKDSLGLGDYAMYTPSDFGAVDDLFDVGLRRSGYQLYSAWRQLSSLGG